MVEQVGFLGEVDKAMDVGNDVSLDVLSEKCMLVALRLSKWSPRKKDYDATECAIEEMDAEGDAGEFFKRLVQKDAFHPIVKVDGKIRTEFYKHTAPWADGGLRLITAEGYLKMETVLRPLFQERQDIIDNFVNVVYPKEVADAKRRLGKMWCDEDYPTVAALRGRFNCALDKRPMPTDKDFRCALPEAEYKKVVGQIRAQVKNTVKASMQKVWERAYEPILHLVTKLKDEDSTFRDSLIGNIHELCSLLPVLNITGNPELNKLKEDLEQVVAGVDPKRLREKDDDAKALRARVASDAEAIVEKYKGFKGAF